MKNSKYLLGMAAALMFSVSGICADGTTSGGTTTGSTTTGGTSTGSTTTTGTTTGSTTTTGTTTGSTTTTGTTADTHGKAAPHNPNEHASDTAKAIQALQQKFDASRDSLIAQRKALLDKLAAATTEADKKAIIDQLKSLKDQQEQVGKQIRDELKTLREQRKGGGG